MSAISYIWCEYRFVWPLGKGCVFQMCEYKWSCNEHTFDVSTDLSGSLVRAVSFECVSHCKYSCSYQRNKSNQANGESVLLLLQMDFRCNILFFTIAFWFLLQPIILNKLSKSSKWKKVFLKKVCSDIQFLWVIQRHKCAWDRLTIEHAFV